MKDKKLEEELLIQADMKYPLPQEMVNSLNRFGVRRYSSGKLIKYLDIQLSISEDYNASLKDFREIIFELSELDFYCKNYTFNCRVGYTIYVTKNKL